MSEVSLSSRSRFAARKLSVLLGVVFVAMLLSACSESLINVVEKVTNTVFGNRPESPERVVENFTKAMFEGRFGEVFLKYGSNAVVGAITDKMIKASSGITEEMARPLLECYLARPCTEGEMEDIMRKGVASEERVLSMKRDWHRFDEASRKMRKNFSSIVNETASQGGLASLSAAIVSQTKETAEVRCDITFGNGEVKYKVFKLVKESGEWKINLEP